ncbi:hypothetical protein MEO93_29590, partial [Dolichospermum sp. ST_sed3]|nr:hypothetical protein [Dolichospermum sp. ST_sed3]
LITMTTSCGGSFSGVQISEILMLDEETVSGRSNLICLGVPVGFICSERMYASPTEITRRSGSRSRQ